MGHRNRGRTTPGSRRRASRIRAAGLALVALLALPPALVACSSDLEPRLSIVRTLQEKGAFEASIRPLQELLAEAPDHPELNLRLGIAFLRDGQPSQAFEPLRKASTSDAYAVESGILLASALLQAGQPREAVRAADRVTEVDAASGAAWSLRANALLQLGELEEALEAAEHLASLDPGAFPPLGLRARILHRLGRSEEAEGAYRELESGAQAEGRPGTAATACTARAAVRLDAAQPGADAGADPVGPHDGIATSYRGAAPLVPSEDVEELLRRCRERYPQAPATVLSLAHYLQAVGRPEDALAVWREGVENAPEVLAFRVGLANQRLRLGHVEDATRTLRDAAETLRTPQAWRTLASVLQQRDRPEEAAAALERAIGDGGDPELLRFHMADLWIGAGHPERARTVLQALEHDLYRKLLEGRLALERGEPAEALPLLEQALESWPDNAGARALAGRAAQQLGDLERALVHYRASVRADASQSDAGLAAAQLALALERPEEALHFAYLHHSAHPLEARPQALHIAIRAAQALERPQVVEQLLAQLARHPRGEVLALAERARLHARKGDLEEAERVLATSGLDLTTAEAEPALLELAGLRARAGRAEAALDVLERGLEARPEAAALHEARGRVLADTGRTREASAAFERALAVEPGHPGALAGRGTLAFRAGNMDAALADFRRAAETNPADPEAPYRVAQILLARGETREARDRLERVTGRFPTHGEAANDLAYLLAEADEELDRALALARRALHLEPGPRILDTLAFVHLRRGETREARTLLRDALATHPDDPTLRYRLGLVLLAEGERDEAAAMLREALSHGAFPEAGEARRTLAELGGDAPAP